MKKIINYFRSALAEMKKVTWPTRQETYRYTILVIAISLGVAAFLGGLDYLFSQGLQILLVK